MDSHQIVRSLGIGATSEVFEAVRVRDDTRVALKRFSAFVTNDPAMRERLRLEVEVLGKLRHPNIVNLLGTVETEHAFALELELVAGSSLGVWNAGYKGTLLEPKLWILAEVTRALGAAHENQILHRDIKPENILVANAGDVKLTDFGLARSLSRVTVTKSGVLIGSLAYMAPEIIDMADATEKSDIFSFGVIAYELLANARPFPGESPQAIIRQIAEGKARPLREINPLIPPSTAALIHACLDPNPGRRPLSIWHVHADLMAQLQASGLLPYCRGLVSAQRMECLVEALRKKRERLLDRHGRLAAGKQAVGLAEKLEILNELKALFPDDAAVDTLLEEAVSSHARESVVPHRRHRLALLLLLGLGLSGAAAGIFFWQAGEPVAKVRESAASLPTPAPNSPPEPAIAAGTDSVPTLPSEAKEAGGTTAAAQPNHGFVRFAVSREVDVYVDDNFVPPERRGRYRTSPGSHDIRMEMKGYLPIHNRIVVKPGKTVVVRAGGDS